MPSEIVYQIQGRWTSYPLEKDEVTIGRDSRNDLIIEHRSVSRTHARLTRGEDGWRVKDLDSRYGTTVNDLAHTDVLLQSGDKIYLHRFPLTFVDSGAALSAVDEGPAESETNTVFQSAVDFTALAASPADLQRMQKLLRVVTKTSEAVLVSDSLDGTFVRVLDLVFEHLPVQRGFIMMWDEDRGDFVTRVVRHKDHAAGAEGQIRFSRTIAEKVVRDRVAVITRDAQLDGRFADGASIMELGIRSAMAAPLWNGDQVDGLIYADTTVQARAFDSFDLDILSALGNQLAVAIEQARLQQAVVEQQVARRRLERYHSPAVIERINRGGDSAEAVEAEERDASVMFADVVGFTSRCESMEPKAVAELLNRYFSELTQVVFDHEGTVDKFIGDCLMAVFGVPFAAEDHARRSVDAALDRCWSESSIFSRRLG